MKNRKDGYKFNDFLPPMLRRSKKYREDHILEFYCDQLGSFKTMTPSMARRALDAMLKAYIDQPDGDPVERATVISLHNRLSEMLSHVFQDDPNDDLAK